MTLATHLDHILLTTHDKVRTIMTYTIDPTDHWKAGDRAYCIRGLKKSGRYIVEKGRVYSVSDAQRLRGMMSDALNLDGVDPGEAEGFWSSRFVCLRGSPPFLGQIAERTRHSWYDAYVTCRDARNAVSEPPHAA